MIGPTVGRRVHGDWNSSEEWWGCVSAVPASDDLFHKGKVYVVFAHRDVRGWVKCSRLVEVTSAMVRQSDTDCRRRLEDLVGGSYSFGL